MMTIKDLTTEDLEQELKRRKTGSPVPLKNPDFTKLQQGVTKMVMDMTESGYQDDDMNHYIYELTMDAIYGAPYWKWLRNFNN